MPQKSMAFSVGSVRAKESTLFTVQDIEQLLNSGSEADILRYLRDKGYGSVTNQDMDTDALLAAEREKLWDYVRDLAAEPALFDVFRVKSDYHNIKAVLKGVLGDRPYEELLLKNGTVGPALIETAVKEQRFDILPFFIKDTAREAYKLLSETGDPQLSDGYIEQAMLTYRLQMAEGSRIQLLKEYMQAVVFYANVKVALRAARAGKSRAFLENALVFCDFMPVKELLTATLSGEDSVLNWLLAFGAFGAEGATKAYKKSPVQFEKYADDYLMQIAVKSKKITLGEEVLLGYYLAKDTELKTVKIISVGVRTGQDIDEIRERLRVLYG